MHIRKRCYPFFAILLCALLAQSCGDDKSKPNETPEEKEMIVWNDAAEAGTQSLIKHFWNQDRWYFNSEVDTPEGDEWANYWPQAHAMDVIIDAFYRSGESSPYRDYFDEWYVGVKQKSHGTYYNSYYDDEAWNCLTMIRLYEATKESKFLDTAIALWNDIKTGWNERGGGGIAQSKDQLWSKNACSNGPGGLIAAKLYGITHESGYLEWAQKCFDWEYNTLVDRAAGRVSDRLDTQTDKVYTVCFTYNQGTFLGLAHELFSLTGEKMYLSVAARVASYTVGNGDCTDSSTGLLRDEGTGDGGLFKGIFIRYATKLIQEEKLSENERSQLVSAFKKNAKALWNSGVDKSDPIFGPDWSKSLQTPTLNTHVSGATMMEAMATLEREGLLNL